MDNLELNEKYTRTDRIKGGKQISLTDLPPEIEDN